jgi:non-ribosomal peptide synthetase component F
MSLGELLALSPTADRHARVRHAFAVPEEVAVRVAQWARHDGGAADSAFVAAWMLLLRRWSGRDVVAGVVGTHIVALRSGGAPRRPVPARGRCGLPRCARGRRRRIDEIEWAWLARGAADGDLAPAGGSTIALTLTLSAAGEVVATLPAEVDAGLARTLLACIVAVASECCAAPERALDEIATIGPAQRARSLEEWHPALHRADPAATVHGAFAAQAALRPDATALVLRSERVTYRELEARATRWAAALRAAGVGRARRSASRSTAPSRRSSRCWPS